MSGGTGPYDWSGQSTETGASGATGPSGSTSPSGATGPSDGTGLSGCTGLSGGTEPSGALGSSGATQPSGFTAQPNAQRATRQSGATGETGDSRAGTGEGDGSDTQSKQLNPDPITAPGKSKIVVYVDQPGVGGDDDVYEGCRWPLPRNGNATNGSDLDVGHAFVEIINGRTGERLRAGLYPEHTIKGVSPGPGVIKPDLKHPYDIRIEETITEAAFDGLKKRILKDRSFPPKYDPDDYNCTDYARDLWDDVLPHFALPDRTRVITVHLPFYTLTTNPISNPGYLGQDLGGIGGIRPDKPNTPAH